MKRNTARAAAAVSRLGLLLLPLSVMTTTAFAHSEASAKADVVQMSLIYGAVALLSVLLFTAYTIGGKEKQLKFSMLYSCVALANLGYFLQSVSTTLFWVMMFNRVSYLGAAYSILVMLLIIIEACNVPCRNSLRILLFCITTLAFLLAASGDWLGLYYSQVSLSIFDGSTRLIKVYGPLHILYPIYLLSYVLTMIAVIIYAAARRTVSSAKHAVFLAVTVLGNVGVWLVEQLVDIEFEFLSISFIVTEIMLLLLYGILRDYGVTGPKARTPEADMPSAAGALPPNMEAMFEDFSAKVKTLTAAEGRILQHYMDGYEISDIPALACISINTVKKHNRSIYQKLAVTSRDELMLYIELFRRCGRLQELELTAK